MSKGKKKRGSVVAKHQRTSTPQSRPLYMHSTECYGCFLDLDTILKGMTADYEAISGRPEVQSHELAWETFLTGQPRYTLNADHDSLCVDHEARETKLKCSGITSFLRSVFWKGHPITFSDSDPAPETGAVCRLLGKEHGTKVHAQINSIVKTLQQGKTLCAWLRENPLRILDPCTVRILASLISQHGLYPLASEVIIIDRTALCYTSVDLVCRAANGARVLVEVKTGGRGSKFADHLETDVPLTGCMDQYPDTPLNRAALQVVLSRVMLQQRYGYDMASRIVHVAPKTGVVSLHRLPEWANDPDIRKSIYKSALDTISAEGVTLHRRVLSALDAAEA
jgi:hypothetical protein